MKFFTYTLLMFVSILTIAQNNWEMETEMPFAISNNAVCEALVDGITYVYSFGGIDTSKIWSGISNKSFRLNTLTNTWEEIDALPDVNTKIAAAASYVNGKIYIVGGYSVLQNGNEISSDKIHIYDPHLNVFETDGANIPIAIDDHVQCIYNDSLIYVITGWSNSTNVSAVQIYDVYNNIWQSGTATPNTSNYKVFGASGTIIGDTIYYLGGAKIGNNFPLGNAFRKGFINPQNALEIDWSFEITDDAIAYRQACININDTIFWIAGSKTSYNYNGIAYNNSGGVEPSLEIIKYVPANGILEVFTNYAPAVMDLRGVAKSENKLFLVGGMLENQMVSNQVFSFVFDDYFVGIEANFYDSNFNVFPNPVIDFLFLNSENVEKIVVYDFNGKLLKSIIYNGFVDVSFLDAGIYFLAVFDNDGEFGFVKFVKH